MKRTYTFLALIFLTLNFARYVNAGDNEFNIVQAAATPVVDGTGDEAAWDDAQWHPIDVFWISSPVDSTDFWGQFKALWTPEKLYLLVEINDNERSDDHSDPVVDYWQDDCLEIFIDEDHSGGDHQYNFNAFAYHVSLLYDAVDLAEDHGAHLFNDHVEVVRTDDGNFSVWELGIEIYDDTYILDGENEPVTLHSDKDMGLSLAYCDNDETSTRETFIGSVETPDNSNDQHWINASEFGTVHLIDQELPNAIAAAENKINMEIFPNPAFNTLNIILDREADVAIFNILGEKVIGLQSVSHETIDIGLLPSGLYMVSAFTESEILAEMKLIIR